MYLAQKKIFSFTTQQKAGAKIRKTFEIAIPARKTFMHHCLKCWLFFGPTTDTFYVLATYMLTVIVFVSKKEKCAKEQ